MCGDVEKFCRVYLECVTRKGIGIDQCVHHWQQFQLEARSMHCMSVDILQLPVTESGNKHFQLLVTDSYYFNFLSVQ